MITTKAWNRCKDGCKGIDKSLCDRFLAASFTISQWKQRYCRAFKISFATKSEASSAIRRTSSRLSEY